MSLKYRLAGSNDHDVTVSRGAGKAALRIDQNIVYVDLHETGSGRQILIDGQIHDFAAEVRGDTCHVRMFGRTWTIESLDPFAERAQSVSTDDAVIAPMPGAVIDIRVKTGQEVAGGDVVLVIESMKMQSELYAPRAGIVEKIDYAVGESFDSGSALLTLLAEDQEA